MQKAVILRARRSILPYLNVCVMPAGVGFKVGRCPSFPTFTAGTGLWGLLPVPGFAVRVFLFGEFMFRLPVSFLTYVPMLLRRRMLLSICFRVCGSTLWRRIPA